MKIIKPAVIHAPELVEATKAFANTLETDDQKEAFINYTKKLTMYVDKVAADWSSRIR